MQRYTKNSTSAANNNQSINNTNIDSARKEKTFSSVENLIFFIDVSKKCEYAKLEDKIKSVGGTIKLFLTDDVTHFVTDKASNVQNTNLLNASSPKVYNYSSLKTPKTPELIESRPNKITTSRTRSRVDEMIHRARLETSVSQPSLLDVALLKNIRVWDSNFANLYLNKLIKKIKLYKSNIKKGISDKIFLTEPFIKIEDSLGKYRPYYKILKSKWPLVNLINCELDNSKTSKQDLVNENKNKKIIKETDNKIEKFGYCELCKCEYDILSVHLKTEQHYSFASDPQNYEALDKLINDKISVKYFLEENLSEKKNQNKQVPINMTKLQYHDYFSKSANDSEKALCVQGKINRVTRQGQVNLESNANGCKKKKSEIVKNNKNLSDNHIKSENHFNYISEVRKSDKETQNYNNSKDNPSLYYKVIKSQSDTVGDLNNKTSDKDLTKPALIVKFRKIRQSELSILNGEAENFMFPKTKTEFENGKKQVNDPKSSKRKYSNAFSLEEKNDVKVKSSSESKKKLNISDSKSKNKEKFSNDYLTNLQSLSYSFERIPSTEPWYNVFCRQDTGKEHTFEYFGGTGYKKLPYEMGHIPIVQSKPYLNFCMICKNKMESNEYRINNTSEELSKKSNEFRIKLENDMAGINCNHKQQVNFKVQSNQQQIDQQQLDMQQIQTSVNSQQTVNKPFKKFYLMNLDMPRKSPREHASTLAMLSCLVKKSNSCQNSVNNDSKEPTPEPLVNINRNISTPSIENDQDSKFENKELESQKDIKDEDNKSEKYSKRRSKSFYNERIQKLTSVALEKEIDYFLKKSYSDCLDFNNPLTNKFRNSIESDDDDNDDEEYGEKEKFQNNINLDDIMERSLKEDLSYNRPSLLSDSLKINASQKKRPVNKTGWPYKKKLLTRRQKGCITGFHHHKGVLVKKSSPWSIINNNTFRNEDNAIHKISNDKILENTNITTTNSFSFNLNDTHNKKLEDKIKKNINNSLKIEDSIINCQENIKNQNIKNEDLPPLNNNLNSQSVLSTVSSVPISVEPINETKSRTQLKTATTTQAVEKNNTNSNSIAPPSPRVLRRPRGRWYRER